MEKVVVFGAGGHAKVVVDVLEQMRCYSVVGLLDDNTILKGTTRWGYSIFGGRDQFAAMQRRGVGRLIVALGDNQARRSVFEEAMKAGMRPVSAIHPSAQLGGRVVLGEGVLLVAGTVVNVDSVIGRNVIINTGATVDHDCRIGDHVHLSPGVHIGGGVSVGDLTHIGIGAVILPSLAIGRGSVVGAGAVVRENVSDGLMVAGNPARLIRNLKENYGR